MGTVLCQGLRVKCQACTAQGGCGAGRAGHVAEASCRLSRQDRPRALCNLSPTWFSHTLGGEWQGSGSCTLAPVRTALSRSECGEPKKAHLKSLSLLLKKNTRSDLIAVGAGEPL